MRNEVQFLCAHLRSGVQRNKNLAPDLRRQRHEYPGDLSSQSNEWANTMRDRLKTQGERLAQWWRTFSVHSWEGPVWFPRSSSGSSQLPAPAAPWHSRPSSSGLLRHLYGVFHLYTHTHYNRLKGVMRGRINLAYQMLIQMFDIVLTFFNLNNTLSENVFH